MATKRSSRTGTAAAPAGGGLARTALVVVESPTKARTIKGFLPQGYRVEASMGHVRDLPREAKEIPAKVKDQEWARLGVNVEHDFEPLYIVPAEKKAVIRELKDALAEADELILATDEDREGESISWHLLEVLAPKVPVKRMVFHEITREAIQDALAHTREVDQALVRAQETRRILDRLVGYTLSPLLWKKIAWGLSAGRVQSVAMRLLVLRERERRAFRAGTYWDLAATLAAGGQAFSAELVALDGRRIATGKDFDEQTGTLAKGKDVLLLDGVRAQALVERLRTRAWRVASVEEKPVVRRPSPPFITSTLQQEANRKLRLSASETMRTAQALYERGFITYMRTDSVHLSEQAIRAARSRVEDLYGREYLPDTPRKYVAGGNVAAQEAHEAIRPAGTSFRTPEETGLAGRELALYDLIWKRTMASQMKDARQTSVGVSLEVDEATFRATGKRIDFAGYLRAYVEGSDDPEAALEDQEVILPALAVGDAPACTALEALAHVTQPPARYTEASLVKALESAGVGRPSTYASIIGTILDRGYCQRQGQALVPTFTAFAVTTLLERHFPELVDLAFTAKMEQQLDDISEGKLEWLPYLKGFYLGKEGLQTQVKVREEKIDPASARTIRLEGLDALVKIGRFGPYLEVGTGEGAVKASLPRDLAPADLEPAQMEAILRQKIEGPDEVGRHPESGEPIFLLNGQYGPYLQLGTVTDENPKPKRASLPRGVKPEDVTLEMATGLLSLPRTLGMHPVSGRKVLAGLGRFGPYVVHDQGATKDYRSLKAEDDVLTVSFERALELLNQPKQGRGRRGAPTPLKELGRHPDDGEPVNLFSGQYGPYVKHGDVTASLPKDTDPAAATLEMAIPLLAARAAMGGGRRKKKAGGARPAAKAAKAAKAPKAKAAPAAAAERAVKPAKVIKAGKSAKAVKAKKAAAARRTAAV